MSSILDPLVDRLRAIPSTFWEVIAQEAGVAKSLPRKLAARDRENPKVNTIQPLVDYFDAVDRGERALPPQVLHAMNSNFQTRQIGPQPMFDRRRSDRTALLAGKD